MSDMLMTLDGKKLSGDLQLAGKDIAVDESLKTAVVISLFTDARALADDLLPDGEDPRGWWGDMLSPIENDRLGSRLWLLVREKQTTETLQRAREYTEQSLAWLMEDGIAKKVTVEVEWADSTTHPRGMLALRITIHRPSAPAIEYQFSHLWPSNSFGGRSLLSPPGGAPPTGPPGGIQNTRISPSGET